MQYRPGLPRLSLLLLAISIVANVADAASFDTLVSPPRLELTTNAGSTLRQKISISNSGDNTARYQIQTADWDITDKGLVFNQGKPGKNSCRPWVKLERFKINVGGKLTRPYRFEVHVPEAPAIAQCRFALIISPDLETIERKQGITVVGQIAVIVYVSLGDARPVLKLMGLRMHKVDNKLVPVATISNSGNAHGRMSGVLSARDASGRQVELQIASFPILPGRTETLQLNPVDWSSGAPKDVAESLQPPIKVKGRLEWEHGQFAVDGSIK